MLGKKAVLAKIEATKSEMRAAESDLEEALREIEVAPRAEKTTISAALEKAFADLRAARRRLEELEALVARDAEY